MEWLAGILARAKACEAVRAQRMVLFFALCGHKAASANQEARVTGLESHQQVVEPTAKLYVAMLRMKIIVTD
jgi:hypothetical protein